jgi:transcriptional regulator with XRE-family HTH domain
MWVTYVNNKITFVNMQERLAVILKHYKLTQQEASILFSVSKANISHILSGRNKASLEFIMSIKDAKKELELEWLIYGRSPMFKKKEESGRVSEIDKPSIYRAIENIEHTLEMINREVNYRLNEIKEEIGKF